MAQKALDTRVTQAPTGGGARTEWRVVTVKAGDPIPEGMREVDAKTPESDWVLADPFAVESPVPVPLADAAPDTTNAAPAPAGGQS